MTKLCCSEQQDGGGYDPQIAANQTTRTFSGLLRSSPGALHLPSAAVCVGVLPGLCVYSSSSDSDSSSDSEGSVLIVLTPFPSTARPTHTHTHTILFFTGVTSQFLSICLFLL